MVPQCVRPDHFLRPTKDNSFAMTGTLTYCRSVKNLLPEDTLHCSHLLSIASQLKCEVYCIPVSALYGNYQLVPGQTYAVCKDRSVEGTEQIQGSITVHKDEVKVSLVWRCGRRQAISMGLQDWQTQLVNEKLLILPMIFRHCAAVWVDEKSRVGVLVPQNGKNYDSSTFVYKAFLGENEYVYLDAIEALKQVISIGTILWIKPDCSVWQVWFCVIKFVWFHV